MTGADSERVVLALSDQSEFGSLRDFLRWAVPYAEVSAVAGHPGTGEQGALDALAVIASSSGLVAALKVLPEFLRSRKTGLSISMTIRGQPFTMTTNNVDEVMPILERLLDA
jgi:hypothetical protein